MNYKDDPLYKAFIADDIIREKPKKKKKFIKFKKDKNYESR
jgi:hypothetical protein